MSNQGTKKFNFSARPNFSKKKIPQTFTCPSGKLRVKSTSQGYQSPTSLYSANKHKCLSVINVICEITVGSET